MMARNQLSGIEADLDSSSQFDNTWQSKTRQFVGQRCSFCCAFGRLYGGVLAARGGVHGQLLESEIGTADVV